jgi:TP901 family phage tail tape measure protein
MGMAGWKTEDMLSGLPGILNLASAGGTDLATTSDIVTDGLTAMGLTAKDTDKFVDIMASTCSNANTNIELMGETLKYVGPVAGSLGIEMDDLSVAIGLMGDAGLKGSNAGTSLRAGLANLVKPTKEMSKAMKEYGVELITNKDGSVDLMATMENLRSVLGELDQTTQAQALSAIFGKEAMSGWASIVNASEEDFNKLTNAIANSDGVA